MSRNPVFAALAPASLALLLTCGGASETGNSSAGRVRVEAFDAPPPVSVQHAMLTVREIALHSAEDGWMTFTPKDTIIDFMQLVAGATAVLADTLLPAGLYSQIRLVLGERNWLVVEGRESPITLDIPSGRQSGIKLNIHQTLAQDDSLLLYVDFDLARSINWNAHDCKLKPVLRVFAASEAGSVSGTVTSAGGAAVGGAMVFAVAGKDTVATLTGKDGRYTLIAEAGTYTLSVSAQGHGSASPSSCTASVVAGRKVGGRDFLLQP